MKVVVVMEVSRTSGGAYNQAMNAVLQMQRLCTGRYDFAVATSDFNNVATLRGLNIDAWHLPTNLFERAAPMLPPSRIAKRLLRRVKDPAGLERRLLAAGADLVYFVGPWGRVHKLQRVCYWATVWDLAHLDHAEFPEVAREFQRREQIWRHTLGPASFIMADSEQLCRQISRHYGVAPERVLAMPFAPGGSMTAEKSRPGAEVMARHGLEPGYFFYPAQFWAHKNHIRILEALHQCAQRGYSLRVVFAGGDMGSRAHVLRSVQAMGLQSQVSLLGFVDAQDMRGLYQGSRALVMPTYFGPTNLPPLEAWSLDVPVIYSRHLNEQAGDAALLADPDDAQEWADCMIACLDVGVCADLVALGRRRLQDIAAQRSAAEEIVLQQLHRLEVRLRCSS